MTDPQHSDDKDSDSPEFGWEAIGADSPEYDLFTSYAHVDNYERHPHYEDSRWVESLHKSLKGRIDPDLAPNRVRIWFDLYAMRGNHTVKKNVETALRASSNLLIFLSRGWLNSEWCQRELEIFLESNPNAVAQGRIFAICMADRGKMKIPAPLADVPGYDFFLDGMLLGDPIPELSGPYFVQLCKLKDHIVGHLKTTTPIHSKFSSSFASRNLHQISPPTEDFVDREDDLRTLEKAL